ncbi:DUF4349 domain-containing protein [Clostridiaceae bacterium M8S5]|nr:DUF4349 domain-containing protein [Clostridiaceae bacterium M8S5]
MNCMKFDESISLYIDGQLDKIDQKEFEQHLENCEKCRKQYEQMKQIIEMTKDIELEELPKDYKKSLRQKLEQCNKDKSKNKSNIWKKYSLVAASLLVVITSAMLLSTTKYENLQEKNQIPYDEPRSAENQADRFSGNDKKSDSYTLKSEDKQEKSIGFTTKNTESSRGDKTKDDAVKIQEHAAGRNTENDNNEEKSIDFKSQDNIDGTNIDNNIISGEADKAPIKEDSIDNNKEVKSKRKLIKNVDLAIEVSDFDEAKKQIESHMQELGGFIENSSERVKSSQNAKNGDMVIRVPVKYIDNATKFIQDLGRTIRIDTSVDDITKNYLDVNSEVENLKIQEERLREVLKKAEKVEEILKIEDELRRIRTEINKKTQVLKKWDDLVQYSTIHLDIEQAFYSNNKIASNDDNIWNRAKEGFVLNINRIIHFFQNLFIGIISGLPVIIPTMILLWLLYIIYKRIK